VVKKRDEDGSHNPPFLSDVSSATEIGQADAVLRARADDGGHIDGQCEHDVRANVG
jgi:hypothetical protein